MMKYIRFKDVVGGVWSIPVGIVAMDRAKHYASEYDDDISRSMMEDTAPLFNKNPYAIMDWAKNNMDWKEVEPYALYQPPISTENAEIMQEMWLNADMEIIEE